MAKPNQNTITVAEGFAGFAFRNQYARLPERFYTQVGPTPVQAPALIKVNHALAIELGLNPEALETKEGVAVLAGNTIPPGAEPLAQAYAGHQFGYANPQLGDGRAILLGELIDRHGRPRDIQLKGAGPTPFSRRGDGRAAIGPVIREYLVSEAMHALGIRTTRALAAVTTGDPVYRETVLPGAVLTRVAASHVRIGTFEFFHQRNDKDAIKVLADFVINRHYPEIAQAEDPYLALLGAVMDAQASLVASWLHIGFIHGVMNTDNMSVSGETIDYGPCAFMDAYDPATVFSSIDTGGRYAYARQPNIALWNLSRFAECLLPLLDDDVELAVNKAEQQLSEFGKIFDGYWLAGMRRKIGLSSAQEDDNGLIQRLLTTMQDNAVDFTQGFRYLADWLVDQNDQQPFIHLFAANSHAAREWLTLWKARLNREGLAAVDIADRMRQVNPLYIPRNHQVEAVIRAAIDDADYAPLHEMENVLQNPFNEQPGKERFAEAPEAGAGIYQTFCGT